MTDRTRQAQAGDQCVDCGCYPFPNEKVHLLGLGNHKVRCEFCHGDTDWFEGEIGCDYCRNDGALEDNICPECDASWEDLADG